MSGARWLARNSMTRASARPFVTNGSAAAMDSISLAALADGQDDAAVARDFAARDEKVS
jgi:hypothetical protein